LYGVTGDAQYRHAGEQAFAYEQSWFDTQVGNWPDFRPEWAGAGRHPRPAFATYWCHGAPGIALARLRAYELLGTENYAQVARWALQTTKQALQHTLATAHHDFSLCHGLAGNAQILLQTGHILPPSAIDVTLVYAVAQQGIALYGAPGRAWPCGVGHGETPGLMLGWAGIGLFYLCLHHPKTPSVLLFKPNMWEPDEQG
jgi:lantibiotic modifying enzyme